MNPILKRYVISSIVTFVAAFCGSIVLQLHGGLPVDVTVDTVVAILGVAGRAAVKSVIEFIAGATGDKTA